MAGVVIHGIDTVIGKLKRYRDTLGIKQHEFLERLSQIGISTATIKFSTAQYDGDNDVIVDNTPEWISENRLAIKASGKSILFIEFGTGVHYVEQHPKAAEFNAIRGEYGQGKGKQDLWGYYGSPGTNGRVLEKGVVLTHGNPPARAMYDAGKDMRDYLIEIAKEVFKQ